jgi:hypothetical protein
VNSRRSGHGRSMRERAALPIVLMCSVWIVVAWWLLATGRSGDLERFVEISHNGVPYVDQAVEYPPLQTALIMLLGHWTIATAVVLTAVVNACATLLCWRILQREWSPRVGLWFLWFALPIQVFMVVRLDAVVVAMTVVAVSVARRGRSIVAGVVFGGAVLFRVWPLVILPALWLFDRRRAAFVAISTTLAGGVLWLAVFGPGALQQVATYRGATMWHIETPLGVAALIRSGGRFVLDAGAARMGAMHGWQIVVLESLTVATMLVAAIVARRRAVDPAGGPSLAAVASLILVSPVASPQYVSWLLPWAAITSSERSSRDVDIAMIATGVLASCIFAAYWGSRFELAGFVVAAGGRIVAIATLAAIGFTHGGTEWSTAVPGRQRGVSNQATG